MGTQKWCQPRKLILPLTIAVIFILALGPLTDPDLFWHLSNGKLIWQTKRVPYQDPFAFTMAGKEWTCHEWLTEVVVYGLYSGLGQAALIVGGGALVAASFALTAARCRTSPYVAAFATLLAALASMPSWGVRPQMVSLLMSSLSLLILERRWPVWTLVPLAGLWANLHGGFATGMAIVGAQVLGNAIDSLRGNDRVSKRKRARQLMMSALGMILATLANPYGIKLLIYPFQTLASGAMREYIVEWFSPDFHKLAFQPLAMLLLALILSLALSRRGPSATSLILLLGTIYAALNSVRHVPLLAVVSAPVLAQQMSNIKPWHGIFKTRHCSRLSAPCPPRLAVCVSVVAIAVLVGGSAYKIYMVTRQNRAAQMERYPFQALQFMRQAELAGNLFNRYSWGGFLIWQGEKVFIDGRADLYGDEFFKLYVDVYKGRVAPYQVFQQHGIRRVVIEPDCALATLLEQSASWDKVYKDNLAVVFLKTGAG